MSPMEGDVSLLQAVHRPRQLIGGSLHGSLGEDGWYMLRAGHHRRMNLSRGASTTWVMLLRFCCTHCAASM